MTVSLIHPAFAAGEISPDLYGRVDLAKFSTGAATIRNMTVNYRGGVKSRAGTLYIGTCAQPGSSLPPRLIPFQFSITQSYALEFGDNYMRVIINRGYVTNTDGSIYSITTPYSAADVPMLKYAQSADVMSLVHHNYPPMDLKRFADTNWTLTQTAFGASIGPPTNVAAVPTVAPSGTLLPTQYQYVVTAVDAKTQDESVASSVATASNSVDMAATAGSVIVTWSPVAGANQYNIYKAPTAYNTTAPVGAQFSYCGTSFGSQFVDTNIVTDATRSPPLHDNPFAPGVIIGVNLTNGGSGYTTASLMINTSTGGFADIATIITPNNPLTGGAGYISGFLVKNGGSGYQPGDTLTISGDGSGAAASLVIGPTTGTWPGVVSYFQQRRIYANTIQQPDTYFMSQPAAYTNFDHTIPPIDTDAIIGTPWSVQVNGIQWMVAMPGGLVTGTGLGAWLVSGGAGSLGGSSNPITPSDETAVPQAATGFNPQVVPQPIQYHLLYVQQGGTVVRDITYNLYANIYTGEDISALSTHLIVGYPIQQWAWCEVPFRVMWVVRSDGILLSLTYLREQDVYGWARHDTQGDVVSVCSVSEPPNNSLYMIVRRTVQGAPQYYLERMDDRIWSSAYDSWCVDSALSRIGPPTGSVSGLDHLDGLTVTGLADGRIIPPTTVANGAISLPWSDAQNIVVGLPYTCQLQSVYLDAGQPTIQGSRKAIFAVTARVRNMGLGVTTGTNQKDGSAIAGDGSVYRPNNIPDWSNMAPIPMPPGQPDPIYGFYTGDVRINVNADWKKRGQIAIEQSQPLPVEVLALVPEFVSGDVLEDEIKSPPQQQSPRGPGPWMLRAA